MKFAADFVLGYLARKGIDYLFGKFITPELVTWVKKYQYSHHYYEQHPGRPSKCHKCKPASRSRY